MPVSSAHEAELQPWAPLAMTFLYGPGDPERLTHPRTVSRCGSSVGSFPAYIHRPGPKRKALPNRPVSTNG